MQQSPGGVAAAVGSPVRAMEDIQRAVLVSMDPAQNQAAQRQALQFLNTVKNSPDGWQLALGKLHDAAQNQGSDVVKFWCMDTLLHVLQHRYEGLTEEQRNRLRRGIMVFVRDILPSFRQSKIVKVKLSVLLCNLLQLDYPGRWPSFWRDLLALLEKGPELMDMFLKFLGSFHDIVLQYDAAHTPEQVRRNSLIKDSMRDSQTTGAIVESLRHIVIQCRARAPALAKEALSALSDQIGWIDTTLILGNDRFLPLFMDCLKDPELQCGAVDCIEELVYRRGPPLERLALIQRLRILEMVASVDLQTASLEFCRELASLVGQTGSVLVATYRHVSDPERLRKAACGTSPEDANEPAVSLETLQQACQASAAMISQALRLALGFLAHPKPVVALEVVEFFLQYVNNALKIMPGSAVYEAEREKQLARQALLDGAGVNGSGQSPGPTCSLVSLQRPEHINYFLRLLQLITMGIRYPRGFHAAGGIGGDDDEKERVDGSVDVHRDEDGDDGDDDGDNEEEEGEEDHDDDECARFVEFREQLLKLHLNMATCAPQAVVSSVCEQLMAVLAAPGSNPEVLEPLGIPRQESVRQHDPLELESILVLFYYLGQHVPAVMGRLVEDPIKTTLACLIRSELSSFPNSPLVSKLYFKTVERYSRFLDSFPEDFLRPVVISFVDQRGLLHPNPSVRGRVCYLLMRLISGIQANTRRKMLPFLNDFLGHIYKVIGPVVSNTQSDSAGVPAPGSSASASPAKSSNENLNGGSKAGTELVTFEDVLFLCEVMGLLVGSQVTGQDCRKYVLVALGHFSQPLQQAVDNQRSWFPNNAQVVTKRLAQLITAMGSLTKQLTKDGRRYFPDLLHKCTQLSVELYVLVAHPQHPQRARDEPVMRKAILFYLHRMVECLREDVLQHLPRVLEVLLRSAALTMQAGNNSRAPEDVNSDIVPVLQLINQTLANLGPLAAPLVQKIFPIVLQQTVSCLHCWDYMDDPELAQHFSRQPRVTPGIAGGESAADGSKEAPVHPYSAAIAERAYLQCTLLQFLNLVAQPGLLSVLSQPPASQQLQPLLQLLLSLVVNTSQLQHQPEVQVEQPGPAGASAVASAAVAGGQAPIRLNTGSVKVSKLALQMLRALLEGWLSPVSWHAPFLQRHRAVLSPPKKRSAQLPQSPQQQRQHQPQGPGPAQKTALAAAQAVKRSADAAAAWAAQSNGDFATPGHPSPPPLELLRQILPGFFGRLMQHVLDPVFDVSDSEYRLCLSHVGGILAALSEGFGDVLVQGCQSMLRGKVPDAELAALLNALRGRSADTLRKTLVRLKEHQQEARQFHKQQQQQQLMR